MATAGTQDYKTHRKFVPLYHYVATGLLVAVLVWSIARMIGDFSVDRLMMFLLVVVVLLIGYFARTFPLGAQDRIIRLEERLRMWKLLPDDLKPHIESFTAGQLVALRVA